METITGQAVLLNVFLISLMIYLFNALRTAIVPLPLEGPRSQPFLGVQTHLSASFFNDDRIRAFVDTANPHHRAEATRFHMQISPA